MVNTDNNKVLQADITIIGGGPGGYVAAIKAAKLGADVVLVEKDRVGGTCLNRGCIPTKALVRSAEVYNDIQDAGKYGIKVDSAEVDMKQMVNRKDRVVKRLVKGVDHLLNQHEVEIVNGKGKILDQHTVSVEGEENTKIKTENIIIATGSKPVSLPIPGTDLPGVMDSNAALQLDELPNKLVIVGGGYIGMEFAFVFANLGVEVNVVEYLDNILAGCDSDISREINRAARRKRIRLHTGSQVNGVERDQNGELSVTFTNNDKVKSITGDRVLMAVGRRPYIGDIGLDKLGVKLKENERGIKVDRKMQTNISNVYAVGDVTGEILLAHVASHQGIVAVKNIMGEETKMNYDTVPSAIFTHPEIATVGLDEQTAQKKGIEYEVGKFPFRANGKVLTTGENQGLAKLIAEKETGRLLGASIIGVNATDLLAEVTLAIENKLTVEDIAETIHAHPTTAETIHEAALDLQGGAIHC